MTLGMPKNPNFSARNSSLALSLAAFRHAVAVPPILPAAYGPTWRTIKVCYFHISTEKEYYAGVRRKKDTYICKRNAWIFLMISFFECQSSNLG